MKRLIWKELCENTKWALFGMLGVGTALYWVAGRAVSESTEGNPGFFSLSFDELGDVTSVAFAAVAFLLGVLETFPEKKHGTWDFLIHRGVSTDRIFAAKALSGLFLYATAVGLPFLALSLWVSRPGVLAAPVYVEMAFPGIADMLSGVAYFFAGMVVGLREARWYGSRLLPLGFAAWGSILIRSESRFPVALLIALVVGTISALLARGIFRAHGEPERLSRSVRALLAMALLAGILLIGSFLTNGAVQVFRFDRLGSGEIHSYYMVDGKGRVLRVTAKNRWIVTVTDREGVPIPEYRGIESTAELYRRKIEWGWCPLLTQGERERLWSGGYRFPDELFVPVLWWPISEDSAREAINWYYSNRERLILGYRRKTGRLIWRAGPEGFVKEGKSPSRRFQGCVSMLDGWRAWILGFRRKVYLVLFGRHQVKCVFVSREGDEVLGTGFCVGWWTEKNEAATSVGRIGFFVPTRRAIHVFDPSGELKGVLPAPYDLSVHGSISLAPLPKRDSYLVLLEPGGEKVGLKRLGPRRRYCWS